MQAPSDDPDSGGTHIVLYRGDGTNETLSMEQLDVVRDDDKDLLWIDIACDAPERLDAVGRALDLPDTLVERLQNPGASPQVSSYGACFFVQVVAVEHCGELRFDGAVLAIAAGTGFLVSVHHRPIPFIAEIRKREDGESHLGVLTADSFVASLLDWQLGTYFEAASDFERTVEKFEESILKEHNENAIGELRKLRKGASRMRRMLAPHRKVFSSLARPDFRPEEDRVTTRHFEKVDDHFERAMDIVENARDLMIGSFELFSNQIALRTNKTMRMLTFATVVIGCQTVIAGVLGMNFNAPFFKTGAPGFWVAVGAMLVVALASFYLGRRSRWF
ncbi:magnesium/cobalt transport protein CorA [Luteimonas cucumeris]|uniref:Magnesium/cobalt transport protein CorA n=1 Tax=Luteimonas cucumeris TaxID=985012 RepID=A0A562L253_9GAMM|nr:CorA family divalent cation transporter [Luteimonas cucumeris]TWI01717.1 magnesium/cobalt transport protein CorA [Luteimonas cucumeris]